MRRVLPGLLAIAAFYADGRGSHGLAFDALLGAIPFAAVSALETFGAFLDRRDDAVAGVQALLWALALALLVLSCAARSPETTAGSLPTLGASALAAALVVFAVKTCVAVGPLVRRVALVRAAKP
jgi:peptidoglycan/LPS O-acetylase OafA/YrhL